MSQSQLDLSKLAVERSPAEAKTKSPRRRRWVSRYVVPATILLGFIALLGASARRQLLSKQSVTVVPVIVKRSTGQQAGSPLFQAPGWIEPRPTSVRVTALAPGVIEELFVVAGQHVAKGEPIAQLIAIDAQLAAEQAQATLAIREGELQRTQAEQAAAITRLEKPVHLQAQLADSESLLAKATTELRKLPFLIRAAKANVAFTRSSLEGKQAAKSAIAGVIVSQAAKDDAAARAQLEELLGREANLQREIDALQAKVNALQEQLELLVEERRQVAEAKAKVVSAAALRDEARIGLRRAQLNVERTTVRAPINGRILRLIASPGTRVMGLDATATHGSGTIVEMYDPNRLQVRADVRLEDVPMVTPDAPVEIETASSGKVIAGRVLQTTSSANIQKNTLEVKVELIDPPSTVSPEMLVTATFLTPKRESKSEPTQSQRIFVPKQLVRSGDGESIVWTVDADGRAMRKSVMVGGTAADGLVEVVKGLNPTDKLIASGAENLTTGDAVVIVGEDRSLGVGR